MSVVACTMTVNSADAATATATDATTTAAPRSPVIERLVRMVSGGPRPGAFTLLNEVETLRPLPGGRPWRKVESYPGRMPGTHDKPAWRWTSGEGPRG